MSKRPKRLLVELPTADEIDDLAITTPSFEVRKFEYNFPLEKADLNYPPCKGQVLVVIRGEKGTVLVRSKKPGRWGLPSGRLGIVESPVQASRRVAMEQCGVGLRTLELAGIYDVVLHYSDMSIKRLHVVYLALTDDVECRPSSAVIAEARFFSDPIEMTAGEEMTESALRDTERK
ncbi:MAG: hypothetical protein A3K67_04980 [Euryarchaeota archaeon RBG_16_62_10]|nr:MAG: hypothetical protein A3K67_04980 [Euryarchaeota archaeon RBG_16_62_10]